MCLLAAAVLSAGDGSFIRADANADHEVNITDPVFTFNFSFNGGPRPACLDAADSNDDGAINISDAIHSLNFLFLGGQAPPLPFPLPGADPTADDMSCAGQVPSGFGTLFVAIQGLPPESLTEFWLKIEHVVVDAAAGTFVVEVMERQDGDEEPAVVGQVTVVVNESTEFEDGEVRLHRAFNRRKP